MLPTLQQAEITRLKEDFQELMMRAKAQIEGYAAQVKEDIVRVREDIVHAKEDMVQVKENMVYTREGVEVIREEVGIIREGVEIRKAETQKVKHDITLLHAFLAVRSFIAGQSQYDMNAKLTLRIFHLIQQDISAINTIRPDEDARVSHPPAESQ